MINTFTPIFFIEIAFVLSPPPRPEPITRYLECAAWGHPNCLLCLQGDDRNGGGFNPQFRFCCFFVCFCSKAFWLVPAIFFIELFLVYPTPQSKILAISPKALENDEVAGGNTQRAGEGGKSQNTRHFHSTSWACHVLSYPTPSVLCLTPTPSVLCLTPTPSVLCETNVEPTACRPQHTGHYWASAGGGGGGRGDHNLGSTVKAEKLLYPYSMVIYPYSSFTQYSTGLAAAAAGVLFKRPPPPVLAFKYDTIPYLTSVVYNCYQPTRRPHALNGQVGDIWLSLLLHILHIDMIYLIFYQGLWWRSTDYHGSHETKKKICPYYIYATLPPR